MRLCPYSLQIKAAILILISQFTFSQDNKIEGSITYQVSQIASKIYDDDYINNYPDLYEESLMLDKLKETVIYEVRFNETQSSGTCLNEYSTRGYSHLYYVISQLGADGFSFYDDTSKVLKQELNWFGKVVNVKVDMSEKWEIDYSKTKEIEGKKCYFALYKGKDISYPDNKKPITAWFTLDVPLPFGPLYFAGLPGLILELNKDRYSFIATWIHYSECEKDVKDITRGEVVTEKNHIEGYLETVKQAKMLRKNRG